MRYNISYELAGFFLLLAMLIICKSNFRERQRVNRYYFLLVYSGLICCVFDVCAGITSKYNFPAVVIANSIFNMFSYGLLPVTGYLFYKYVQVKVPEKLNGIRDFMPTVILGYLGFFAVYVIMSLSLFIGGKAPSNQMNLYIMSIILRDFTIILGIVLLLRNWKNYSPRNHIAQILLIFFNIVPIIFQIKTMRTTVETVSLVFICLVFLYAFEIPDFIALKETMELLKQKKLEEEEAKKEAIRAGENKERFLSNMSHEIRTPLNAILGLNEMIIKDEKDDELKQVAISMKEAGRDLLKSMNRILDISESETEQGNVIEGDLSFIAPKAKILVVDDKEINLFVVSRLLKDTKINITAATGGEEAIEILEKNDFDLLLIDHMMPGMDGIELLTYIREHDLCKGVPAIIYTANAIEGAEDMYLSKGFAGYLSKPAGREALEKMLRTYLPENLLEERTERDEKTAELSESEEFLLDKLMNSTVIDIGGAVAGFDSVASYLDVLRHFMLSFKENMAEIKGYEPEGLYDDNLKLYTIAVHSMKSAAALVGIYDLSELSKKAEAAAKSGDMSGLIRVHEKLVEKLEEVDRYFDTLNTERDNHEEDAEVPTLLALLNMLSQAMEEFDVDSMDEYMKSLMEAPIFDNCLEKRKALEKAVNNLDTDEGQRLVDEIMTLLGEEGKNE
ncbi:MAG: response regulator [Acetatifactor sp.]|nr:response regulator [Acetatifactor sp.]